jgi:hypothetical protein
MIILIIIIIMILMMLSDSGMAWAAREVGALAMLSLA